MPVVCASQSNFQHVPVREFWGSLCCGNFHDEVFGVIHGYIDESYDGEKLPNFFTLSCSLAHGGDWAFIEALWIWVLGKKNKELVAAGREPIRRYHAVDCFNRSNEFKGWSQGERNQFCKELFEVFRPFPTSHIALTMSARDIHEVWPEKTQNPLHFAYYLLLRLMMLTIGKDQAKLGMLGKTSLVYERCGEFGESLLKAFNHMKDDSQFEYGHIFTTIAPMGWEDCIPLQPADLVAYEIFRDAKRRALSKEMHLSLSALQDLENFRRISADVTKKDLVWLRGMTDRQESAII